MKFTKSFKEQRRIPTSAKGFYAAGRPWAFLIISKWIIRLTSAAAIVTPDFGMVIRLCLAYGVHPVFIPIAEPWRNGVVEHFNNTYDKKFYHRQWFSSYTVLKRQSKNFQRFHNKHHRYSFLKGKTPFEMRQAAYKFTPVTVGSNTKMLDLSFIPDGCISVIRFIRSDRKLDIFGERFEESKELVYSYVRA